MAAMSTVLTEFSDLGNSRTYTTPAHTALEPRLLIQKRKVAVNGTSVIEDTCSVISSTEDADGVILDSKVLFEAKVRRPINGLAADVTAALVIFRDMIASDNFTNTVNTQEWLS